MKNAIFSLLFLSSLSMYSQLEKKVEQQFNIKFPSNEEKQDLVALRSFLESKDNEYATWRASLEDYKYISVSDSAKFVSFRNKLKTFLDKHPGNDNGFEKKDVSNEIQSICKYSQAVTTTFENGLPKDIFNVQTGVDNLEEWIRIVGIKSVFATSINNINKDRDAAAKAIQQIYNVEKGDQEYKTKISLYYAIIIFFLIVISFYFLFSKSSPEIGNDFLNGNGLQFIALFAIIISTILFGILGILEGKELAAILSGIAGFILGKGLNVKINTPPQNQNN